MLPQPAVEVDDDASPADVFRSGAWSPPAKARVDMIPGHVARFLEAPTPGRREELRYVARRAAPRSGVAVALAPLCRLPRR
jgi:hypothetical protein